MSRKLLACLQIVAHGGDEAEGYSIALFNVAGTFHARDDIYTNVNTGEALGPLTERVWSYPVKVQRSDVLRELD